MAGRNQFTGIARDNVIGITRVTKREKRDLKAWTDELGIKDADAVRFGLAAMGALILPIDEYCHCGEPDVTESPFAPGIGVCKQCGHLHVPKSKLRQMIVSGGN